VNGVVAKGIVLRDPVLTSVATDLLSVARPVLADSGCGSSARLLRSPGGFDIGPPWGVCAND
jgi:hypothetical protein